MASIAQRRRALQAADELLNNFGIDQELPIDIFDVVDRLGLWLVFNPLNSLLGAVVPKGDGGIMLTTERRPAVQRYTAAHEIGHWILDIEEPAFDTQDDIFHPSADRERLAQIFAGQLLMPPPLVYATCERYGISDAEGATGTAVYSVARDMGASYEAAVRQLGNLHIIDRTRLDYLLSLTPAEIKTELCHGHRPAGAIDVWPLNIDFAGNQITVTEGDELFLALPENRTTGYRWLTDEDLQVRADREVAPPPPSFADDQEPPVPIEQPTDTTAHGRSAADVKRALARIPGNAGMRRTLPSRHTAGEAEQETETVEPVDRYSRWDVSAAEVPSPDLQVVEDRYQAGWAVIPRSAIRAVRQAIAGRQDLAVPEAVYTYRSQQASGELSATSLRPSAIPVAATGRRFIALRSLGEGTRTYRLSYTSAIDPLVPTIESYQLNVVVSPTPQVQHRREILEVDLDEDSDDRGRFS